MAKLIDFVKLVKLKVPQVIRAKRASVSRTLLLSIQQADRKWSGKLPAAQSQDRYHGSHIDSSLLMTSKSLTGGTNVELQELQERLPIQQGSDHAVSWRRGLSRKNYPQGCPPLNVLWYHAVDVR